MSRIPFHTAANTYLFHACVGYDSLGWALQVRPLWTIPVVRPTRVDENQDKGVVARPPGWAAIAVRGLRTRVKQPALAVCQSRERRSIRDGVAAEQSPKDALDGWQAD